MQIGKTLGLAALALFVVVTSAQPYGADHKHRGQCPIYTKASKNCDLSQAVLPMTGSTFLFLVLSCKLIMMRLSHRLTTEFALKTGRLYEEF
jgi:hypothetical protein